MLAEHGPLGRDDILARLQADGVTDPEGVARTALNELDHPARDLNDGRWVWLPTVLAGRVFTHRVDSTEVAHDLLTVTPDLDPITELSQHEQYQRLADGSAVSLALPYFDDEHLEERGVSPEVVDESGALLLEPGTLHALGVTDGDLVGIRLSDAGLVLEKVETANPSVHVGARLAAALDPDEPVFLDLAVWALCAEDPELFAEPVVPLTEIVEAQRLAYSDGQVAAPGFDFERWRFERDCERLSRRYDIDADDALALRTLVAVYDHMSEMLTALAEFPDDADDADEAAAGDVDETGDGAATSDDEGYGALITEFGSALGDPFLAELFRNETVGGGGSPAALGLFAETLEPQVPRGARVAFRWLRATALEQTGAIESAERELLTAESMDTEWPLTLLDLARFASDRGDAERGLALLRRAGAAEDHPLARVLDQHRASPRTDLGRNDACWCGSGRKYKKCHLGREQLSLADRVGWLYLKACQHVFVTEWRDLVEEVAEARAQYCTEGDATTGDPLFVDAVLFEGGAFADFLAKRGFLLPDDERLLAEQWQLLARSVFEVQDVAPGRQVRVRDVRTGDVYDVQERTASRSLQPGQLICTRVTPTPEAYEFFGGIDPVALHERDLLIDLLDSEPDPVDLVDFLSRRFAPATLVNTEGDPLAICEATVRVDPGIGARLDDAFDRVDEDAAQWFEHVETHGVDHISASLTLDGDRLAVQTNSERRMDRVLATLSRLDPSMTVLDDARRPLRDAADAAELAGTMAPSGSPGIDPKDPEVAAALDEVMRRYEAAWLDEPIPSLNGHTPRQAADDPTRRDDLIRLLDSFPVVEGSAGMDPERLRAALGLG
ncbi:SEC-C domain-containing protein [Mycobacterium sp. Y57]|uniref:SEC-C domain-containing protein n=1 Tax=Mycolicibacterium xanthum TaxID=2796469 RepID=UPI001C84C235|nr:SEC-C domain-containing protein [Mycolicibacterium xanthum]MBX7435444.1 SEC-C domain-containing protein [Mycolicibacterium xanthum]